jgi:membrane-bound ClpP family serine protease
MYNGYGQETIPMIDPAVGWALIIAAMILFIVEGLIPGQTFMMVPGVFLIVLGAVILGTEGNEDLVYGVGILGALGATIIAAILTVAIYQRLGRTQVPQTTVAESLIGKKGIVTVKIIPHHIKGKVKIGTTIWSARADTEIDVGSHVLVVDSEGVHVFVEEIRSRKKRSKDEEVEFEIEED